MKTRRSVLAVAALAFAGAASSAHAAGGDVVLQAIGSVSNSGVVGGVRGYVLGSNTCNIGTLNIAWTSNSTPGLGMNAFRLHNGRLEQVGQSWCKLACCAAAGSGCGMSCNGQGGSVLGAGCLDVYGSGWNSIQNRMGPRSQINAYTGQFVTSGGGSGFSAISRHIQVAESDMSVANFPGARFFVEGIYVSTEDAQAGAATNNTTYQAVNVSTGGATPTYAMSLSGAVFPQIPAIRAWRDHGLGVNNPDTSVAIGSFFVPGEGNFHYGHKVRDNGNGTWTYDYAVYNLNSDRSGGSLSIPVPEGVTITNIGFHDVDYHSGEVYDNTDWANGRGTTDVAWNSPQTHAQNPNSNALRWGTMYNFWFTANRPPASSRQGTLGLFKPGTPASVNFSVSAPQKCRGDHNGVGGVSVQDLFDFLEDYFGNVMTSDVNNSGGLSVQDIFDFLALYFGPC